MGDFKAIWKMVRGLILRVVIFTPIVMVALIWLVPMANEKIVEKVMMDRAEMTYSGILTSDTQEFLYGEAVPCKDLCAESFLLEAGKAKYYYALTDEFSGTRVRLAGNGETSIKVLGRKERVWMQVAEFYEAMEYIVGENAEYDALAFAVTNNMAVAGPEEDVSADEDGASDALVVTDGSGVVEVSLSVLAGSLAEDVATETGEKCIEVKFDNLVDFPVKMFQIMNELKENKNLEEVFDGLDKETGASKLVRHYATVCTRKMKNDVDYDKLQLDLAEAIGANWRVLDVVTGETHASAYLTYQPLLGKMTGYFLVRAGKVRS